MDMSFARRRKASFRSDAPDLSNLLAELGARQASTRTAKIQSRVSIARPAPDHDPLVDIFAPEGASVDGARRSTNFSSAPVIGRQSK